MTPRPPISPVRQEAYSHQAARPLNALLLIAPGLFYYHAITAIYGSALAAPALLEAALAAVGAPAVFIAPVAVVIVLLAQHIAERQRWKFRPRVLLTMALEAALWALPLLAMGYLVALALPAEPASAPRTPPPAATAERSPAAAASQPSGLAWTLQNAARAAGAGIYEEFVFRLLLLGLAHLLLVDALGLKHAPVAVGSAIVGGVLFSALHFDFAGLGGGEPFAWGSFLFLALAGGFWGGLYFTRGFGIAAASHVIYDLYAIFANAA